MYLRIDWGDDTATLLGSDVGYGYIWADVLDLVTFAFEMGEAVPSHIYSRAGDYTITCTLGGINEGFELLVQHIPIVVTARPPTVRPTLTAGRGAATYKYGKPATFR